MTHKTIAETAEAKKTTTLIDPTAEAKKAAALNITHSVFVVDKLLKATSDGYQVRVTIGWETPQGTLMPVGTLIMPMPFAVEFAEALTQSASEGNKKRDKD